MRPGELLNASLTRPMFDVATTGKPGEVGAPGFPIFVRQRGSASSHQCPGATVRWRMNTMALQGMGTSERWHIGTTLEGDPPMGTLESPELCF